MNTNQRALDLFGKNEYVEALELFRKAVEESRYVQSLNNLAWMYSYEEEDDEKALELIKEAIQMNPSSYFPYNILGEIYMRQKKWKLASYALLKSISIQPSNEAYHNLAVAKYYLGDLQTASDFFIRIAGNSDNVTYSHVKCLIELGKRIEAKEKLDVFNVDADEFVGEIEVADLYVELDCFKEAVYWFEKGWKKYWKDPYWVSRFIYALFNTKDIPRIHEVVHEAIEQIDEEIKDTHQECEEDWTENDKDTYIKQLLEEKNKYEKMVELIPSGYIPPIELEPTITGACYLFGCKQHSHSEYQE
ncbi:tetratricopeptide repeat protein [Bacillus tuaregi]|uniref:tetratricopeptide repeat protein n=1 Tax=Bacillus tuaregi TaxID=1816695 RepID=UPI0008F7F29A|nr:hypothetical protein [Bacillus tuaregi]